MLTRVAASHIRVGTFQFFAARQDTDKLRRLALKKAQEAQKTIQGAVS